MYVELLVLIENKVYLKNMLFDKVLDLKAHVILTCMVLFHAIMVLEIHNLQIHQKRLHSSMIHILLLKFYDLFKFLVGLQAFNTQCNVFPVMDFW
jgi:hypothetical protein